MTLNTLKGSNVYLSEHFLFVSLQPSHIHFSYTTSFKEVLKYPGDSLSIY